MASAIPSTVTDMTDILAASGFPAPSSLEILVLQRKRMFFLGHNCAQR